jgi:hypothetical protein
MVLEQLMRSINHVWRNHVFRIYRDHVWNCDGLVLWTKICKSHLELMASHKWLVKTPIYSLTTTCHDHEILPCCCYSDD